MDPVRVAGADASAKPLTQGGQRQQFISAHELGVKTADSAAYTDTVAEVRFRCEENGDQVRLTTAGTEHRQLYTAFGAEQ